MILRLKNSEQPKIPAYDLKCSEDQNNRMEKAGTDVVNRFYYINFALFFFFLVYKKHLSSTRDLKNQSIIALLIPLLIGTFGITAPFYTTYHNLSIFAMNFFVGLLNMNIASALIAIILLS